MAQEKAELALSIDPAEARAQLRNLRKEMESTAKAGESRSPLFEGVRDVLANSRNSGAMRSANNVLDTVNNVSTVLGVLGGTLQQADGWIGSFGRALSEATSQLKTATAAPQIAQSAAGSAAGMLAPFAQAGLGIDPRLESQLLDVQIQRQIRMQELQHRLENASYARVGAVYAHRIGNAISGMAAAMGG